MLTQCTSLWPLEILLHTIFYQYLSNSYCLTIISEYSSDIKFPVQFVYINPEKTREDLEDKLLRASENGCSDYIVQISEPQKFISAFERVNHLGNIRRSDRKIVILPFFDEELNRKRTILNVLNMKQLHFVANLLLVVPSTKQTSNCVYYDLVTHNFEGEDEDINKAVTLSTWDNCTANFDRNVNFFPHDITNLFGKRLKVAGFTYKPYVLLDLNTSLVSSGRDGIEMRIIEEFCRWVNCTIEIVDDGGYQWGEIYENGTGVGIMGSVLEDRADIGITALYSWYEQYCVMDYTAPYIRSAVTCIVPAARMLPSWELPVLPFSLYMWLGILFTFFHAFIGLAMAKKTFDGVCLTTFGLMVTQSRHDAGSNWRIRSVTGWLLITGLIIDNAYSSGLASSFTVRKYEKSIDTIQDLLNRKMEWGATHDAWILSLIMSPDPLVKQLVKQFRIYSAEVLEEKSFSREMAFSIEILPAGYFAIGEYITEEAVLDLEIMLEEFYYEQCIAMLRKNSPYTKKISKLVGRLHASGLLLAWETQVALKYLNYKVQLEVKLSRFRKYVDITKPLALQHVVGIFIIYITGVLISIIMFIGEIFRKKK